MSWLDVLKKNDKEFEQKITYNNKTEEIVEINNDLKDVEEEFDYTFNSTITDIKIDFADYIKELGLPFLDKNSINDYSFYDFIKYNSENFIKLSEKIQKENEEYENEDDEDEQFENYYEGEQA
jgi:hypothetical protein